MTTNAMQPRPSGSPQNSDLQLIRSWLLELSRFCAPLNDKDLREKVQCYSTELLEDVAVSAFTKSTLAAGKKRFTKFPSYPDLLKILPVTNPDQSGDSGRSTGQQRNNSLAYAAANDWLERHGQERQDAHIGGYLSELQGWLVVEFFRMACAGQLSGSFEPGRGYVLQHVPSVTVPAWRIDSWTEREAERRKSRLAVTGKKSGFKRLATRPGAADFTSDGE